MTNKEQPDAHSVEHLLGIFAALLRLLPADSAARIRTLAKFVEKDYEKLVKLTKLREDYARRLGLVDRTILKQKKALSEEEQAEKAEEWFSRRLDAGLFCLQVCTPPALPHLFKRYSSQRIHADPLLDDRRDSGLALC